MTAFPMLPPNSSLDGPRPPTEGAWVVLASGIFRKAGLVEPLRVAESCAQAALTVMHVARMGRAEREDLEALDWLLWHGRQWVSLELARLDRVEAAQVAAE